VVGSDILRVFCVRVSCSASMSLLIDLRVWYLSLVSSIGSMPLSYGIRYPCSPSSARWVVEQMKAKAAYLALSVSGCWLLWEVLVWQSAVSMSGHSDLVSRLWKYAVSGVA